MRSPNSSRRSPCSAHLRTISKFLSSIVPAACTSTPELLSVHKHCRRNQSRRKPENALFVRSFSPICRLPEEGATTDSPTISCRPRGVSFAYFR